MEDSQEASPVKAGQESASPTKDDANGHLKDAIGDLTPRYKVLKKIGEGTFGRVFECWDVNRKEHVAIKISKIRDTAMKEVDVLIHLADSKRAQKHCVQMRRWFELHDHTCIVFEKLGLSLYDFLKLNKFQPFSVPFVREFGRQLLASVECVHDMRLIHTDLKPENILLASSEYKQVLNRKRCYAQESFKLVPKSTAIKLIDFGCAVFDKYNNNYTISTRYYRAPEGKPLFKAHEELQHLAMMEKVLGPIPRHMIRHACPSALKFFKKGEKLNWPQSAVSDEDMESVKRLVKLKDMIASCFTHQSRACLTELLKGLLAYDPNDRLTAREALKHPFFQER